MNDSVCHCSFLVDPREGCSSTPSRAQATSGLMGHGSSRSLCTSCGVERRNHAPGIPSSIPLRAPRRSASRSTPGGARLEPRRDAPHASKADGIRPLAQAVRWPTFARPRIERERIPAVVGALSLDGNTKPGLSSEQRSNESAEHPSSASGCRCRGRWAFGQSLLTVLAPRARRVRRQRRRAQATRSRARDLSAGWQHGRRGHHPRVEGRTVNTVRLNLSVRGWRWLTPAARR
jgi:hypothetical protein